MQAEIHVLFSSPNFEIRDFKCRCLECSKSAIEHQENFSISFIRKGNFYFNIFRNSLDAYNGYILVNKPGYDYSVTHVANMPDECTIISFKKEFYEQIKDDLSLSNSWFWKTGNIQSLLLKSAPELDCLHLSVLQQIKYKTASRLGIENLVIEILQGMLSRMTEFKPASITPASIKKNHLTTIELAKEYINENFTTDLSLFELADHCHVSPFHFSRIFKIFTNHSPAQYLQSLRLKHAELMLKTTSLPVTDVAFSSGFSSLDYFSSAFKKKFKLSPSLYRTNSLS
jgi:AraC family transcriptional regulator